MDKKKEVVVIYHDHLDPEWARCYNRPLYRNGILLRSYADVWDYIIESWEKMAGEGYGYSEGQYLVWRTWLERHPDKKEWLKEQIAQGRLEILLQGELTPETNYIPAEGLCRNYLLAKEFYEEFCGENYEGTKLAWIWDAFGNSANMPQILKLAGAEMVGGTKYRVCVKDYWTGIDGTSLPCVDSRLHTDSMGKGGFVYYRLSRHVHCRKCGGYGCDECDGRGMIAEHNFTEEETLLFLEEALKREEEKQYVMIGGEEVVPNHCILDAMEKLNEKYRGSAGFRFGSLSEFWKDNREYYESNEASRADRPQDLNPVHQGCYVTRIENKQRVREITYKLLRAEARVAGDAWKHGFHKADACFVQAWRDLLLNMHHDSISGAHIDAGQAELMDYLDEAESIAGRYVCGNRIRRTNRIRGTETGGKGIRKKQLGKMEVFYEREGIVEIRKEGRDLFGQFCYENLTFTKNRSNRIHIGELLLQCEWGDNHNAYFSGEPVALGADHYAVYEDEEGILWRGRHEAMDPGVKLLEWEMRLEASEDGERLDVTLDVNWDTTNRRLRLAVPVNDHSHSSVWEIPFGFVERSFDPEAISPFSDDPGNIAIRSIGEYPALHWVRHEIDADSGVILLNKGLPSVKWIPGCFELSLLRSPTMTGDTVLPSVDEIWDVDGVRDMGKHRFEFSIWPYTSQVSYARITQTGYEYNDATLELPFLVEGDVVVTAFKPAEDGESVIVRIQEANGCNSTVSLFFEEERRVREVDLMERVLGEEVYGKTYKYLLRKHQILTLAIR